MPEQYRQITRIKLETYLSEMDERHRSEITTHTMTPWLNTEEAKRAKSAYDRSWRSNTKNLDNLYRPVFT